MTAAALTGTDERIITGGKMDGKVRCPKCGWYACTIRRVLDVQHRHLKKLQQRREERECLNCRHDYATLDGVIVPKGAWVEDEFNRIQKSLDTAPANG